MSFYIPLAAAAGCAICNGVAAVLQKTGADAQKPAHSLQPALFVHLLKNAPYLGGIALDVAAWALTLVAVHSLPLFLVQAVIASNIVITALVERFVLHRAFAARTYVAIVVVLFGLVLLSFAALAGNRATVSAAARGAIIAAPLVLIAAGAIFVRLKSHASVMALAALAGIAFGGTSVVGRIIHYPHTIWHLAADPLVYALMLYGAVAILLFTIALQRSLATKVNAAMVALEMLAPAVVGIALFGDSTRPGLWPLAIGGVVFVLAGCLAISGITPPAAEKPTNTIK